MIERTADEIKAKVSEVFSGELDLHGRRDGEIKVSSLGANYD